MYNHDHHQKKRKGKEYFFHSPSFRALFHILGIRKWESLSPQAEKALLFLNEINSFVKEREQKAQRYFDGRLTLDT